MKQSAEKIQKRYDQIISLLSLNYDKTLTVNELAATFGVSAMTIRRDLARLSDMGLVKRNHGSATLEESTPLEGPTHNERLEAIKSKISEYAAHFIQDQQTVFLGPGSTLRDITTFIQRSEVQIVTNNLLLNPQYDPDCTCITLIGGQIHPASQAVFGSEVLAYFSHHESDLTIISCTAYEPGIGAYTSSPVIAETTQQMVRNAKKKVILLVDFRKIGVQGNFISCTESQIDYLITDEYANPNLLDEISKNNVKIIQIQDWF